VRKVAIIPAEIQWKYYEQRITISAAALDDNFNRIGNLPQRSFARGEGSGGQDDAERGRRQGDGSTSFRQMSRAVTKMWRHWFKEEEEPMFDQKSASALKDSVDNLWRRIGVPLDSTQRRPDQDGHSTFGFGWNYHQTIEQLNARVYELERTQALILEHLKLEKETVVARGSFLRLRPRRRAKQRKR